MLLISSNVESDYKIKHISSSVKTINGIICLFGCYMVTLQHENGISVRFDSLCCFFRVLFGLFYYLAKDKKIICFSSFFYCHFYVGV